MDHVIRTAAFPSAGQRRKTRLRQPQPAGNSDAHGRARGGAHGGTWERADSDAWLL